MAKRDAKTHLLDHSQAKVNLLEKYLDRYLNIIANDRYTERIKIYDLFCGEGIYEDEGEGSPLVILRAIEKLHSDNVAHLPKIIPIDCQFNDIEKDKIEKVKQVIANKSLHNEKFGSIEYTSNDYQDEVKTLILTLPKLRKEKAFIFIDPYGYRDVRPHNIKELLQGGKSEVLLFLPIQFMYRFDESGTPEALKDFIEELMNYEKWKTLNPKNVWEYISNLNNAFKSYLGTDFFVDTFTIQKDKQTVFCLFFFSSHIRGFEKMLEAKWEIDKEQGKGFDYWDTAPSLFTTQTVIHPLEEKLISYLKEGPKSNKEIYKYTLHCGYLPTHTTRIFKNIHNILLVEDDKGQEVRKNAFYISYDYTYKKEKIKKVKIKLK